MAVVGVTRPALLDNVEELDFNSLTFAAEADNVADGCKDTPGPLIEAMEAFKHKAEKAEDQMERLCQSPSRAEKRVLQSEKAELKEDKVISSPLTFPISEFEFEDAPSLAPQTRSSKVSPSDFELLRVVGQGSFGKVLQVQKKGTDQIYAMKIMAKRKILEKEHAEYIKAESAILQKSRHPFIITLRYSFQTKEKLYLVMDFINGGHLFYNLYKEACFKHEVARFFTAEIVSAVSHLHSLDIVHRDLKPENVLVDHEGHVVVTDFGLAKEDLSDDNRANSFVGTMQYMAPEVITGNGHGKSVDWWSVGILLYEMSAGHPPYENKNKATLQKQILGGKLKLPTYLFDDTRNLLKGLLQKDPKKRLGHGPNGSNDVKRHAYFKGVNWKLLEARAVESPFKDKVSTKDIRSVENFDKIWTDQKPEDSPPPSPANTPQEAETAFVDFSYTAPSHLKSLYQHRYSN